MGGKTIRLKKQIYADVQLPDTLIQVVFLVVQKLSRPCIIGIDLLDELKSRIDLENKTISFPLLEGKPFLKIMKKETEISQKNRARTINHLEKDKELWDINYEEINQKIEKAVLINKEKNSSVKFYGNTEQYSRNDPADYLLINILYK